LLRQCIYQQLNNAMCRVLCAVRQTHNARGSIFIITLWSLCLLSILAVGLGNKVSQDINVASYFQNKPQAQYLAEAAIKRAQVVLEDDTNSFDCLNEFWSTGRYSDDGESVFKEAELGNGVYSIGMVDEDRKVNINTASRDVMERLFRIASGTDIDDAHIIASSIVDWRDTDSNPLEGGAENSFYKQLEISYECKDGNFQVLEELLLVRRMTNDVFLKVKDFITVYGDGKININTAGYEVLYALGMNDALVDKIIFYRRGDDGIAATEDDNILKNLSNIANDLKEGVGLGEEELNKIVELTSAGLLTVSSRNFSINAEGKIGRRRERIGCIVDREKKVKYWREQ